MAVPYHGKTSNVFWATSAISNITGWSVSLTCSTADSTSRHASNTGRTREAGYSGGTATATGKVSGDLWPLKGATGTLELLRTGTNTDLGYKGTATVTGASISHGHTDVAEATYTFQWDDTVTCTVTKGT